jgi:hypothetical protein
LVWVREVPQLLCRPEESDLLERLKKEPGIKGGNQMKQGSFAGMVFPLAILAALLLTSDALSHCDGLDGPVVKAARKALESGNINLVLIWVKKPDEAAVREVFQKTLAVRKLSAEAKELADLHFFETLVRLHRAGEGAAYTGLKPAGRDLGPAIPAADEAIVSGDAASLAKFLTDSVQKGVLARFAEVMRRKDFDRNDVEKGREFVKAYVEFIHYIERLYEAAQKPVHGHAPEPGETAVH